MGDVEDPDLFVAQPMYEWQQSDMGKWIMEHSKPTPMWKRNISSWGGHTYNIYAYLLEIDYTYFLLKYK